MDTLEIINNKYKGLELHKSDVETIILGYAASEIDDDTMKKFLEAIRENDMTEKEIADFVDILVHNGDTLEFPFRTIDEYSTDNIMDKSSLILVPLLSSMGVKTLNISESDNAGNALRLGAIDGIQLELSTDEVIKQMEDKKAAFVVQGENVCPLNKKIFNLAIKNNLVSLPLVIVNTLCKLLISNSNTIVLDIKIGLDGFITNLEDARKAADIIIKIGHLNGKKIICVLTNQNMPLGKNIGNSLEILEVIDTLKGNGTKELNEYIINLGSLMLSLDKDTPVEESIEYIENALENTSGYDKFKEIIEYQKGNLDSVTLSAKKLSLKSLGTGYICGINLHRLCALTKELGGSDEKNINNGVGFKLHKTVGDYVTTDDELVTVYYDKQDLALKSIYECFVYSDERVEKPTIIYDIVR